MRAARGLVNWSVRDLSEKSGVHRNTITNFETGKSGGDPETLLKLRRALEAAGVEFIPENGGGAGVRLKKPAPTTHLPDGEAGIIDNSEM
ncbi:helix-turn-helix domain-containing protein [Mesorhizobium sp. IMUNJ 23033]|uniref:helix-turn-helix domain-containing protein n=1 Tax=Mesorhizobium sp. IMUNJ 23033 TaxID=3378039 RepID=UPI00384CA847